MISLKREETRQYSSVEALVEVRYRIPDAAEAEVVITEQWKDTKIFEKFVIDVKSAEIDGWEEGVKAETVRKTPGTFSLIHLVAIDVVNSMRGDFERKK